MSKLDEFKNFVKENPKLLKYVKDGSMTWQKFYEMYDMYGEGDVWKEYLVESTAISSSTSAPSSFSDIVKFFKSIDLDSVQDGVNSLQRVIGVVQDFGTKDSSVKTGEYKPRPIYKHFED